MGPAQPGAVDHLQHCGHEPLGGPRHDREPFLLQMAARALDLGSSVWGPVQSLDLGHLGYGMVAGSVLIRAGAAIVWKKRVHPKERT